MANVSNPLNRYRIQWVRFPLVGLMSCHCGFENKLNFTLVAPERKVKCRGCGEEHNLILRELKAQALRDAGRR